MSTSSISQLDMTTLESKDAGPGTCNSRSNLKVHFYGRPTLSLHQHLIQHPYNLFPLTNHIRTLNNLSTNQPNTKDSRYQPLHTPPQTKDWSHNRNNHQQSTTPKDQPTNNIMKTTRPSDLHNSNPPYMARQCHPWQPPANQAEPRHTTDIDHLAHAYDCTPLCNQATQTFLLHPLATNQPTFKTMVRGVPRKTC